MRENLSFPNGEMPVPAHAGSVYLKMEDRNGVMGSLGDEYGLGEEQKIGQRQ